MILFEQIYSIATLNIKAFIFIFKSCCYVFFVMVTLIYFKYSMILKMKLSRQITNIVNVLPLEHHK